MQYVFVGVEEVNDENNKAIPNLPICGISDGKIEKCKNELNTLRSYLYPNVNFELITNVFNGKNYIIIAVPRQTGGPFMVSEKAARDKKLHIKPGRYVRIEVETRLARVDEEYDLLRKFFNFHFSSLSNSDANLDDLNLDYINEFIAKTSNRNIMSGLSKIQIAHALKLIDKNDDLGNNVKNYALLMFAEHPEKFIPYAYTEIIIDMYGTKRKMEAKTFKGPIWKQYYTIINFINDNFLNELVIREDDEAENRRIFNFPFTTIEELVANAIVHNNYENKKPIQIYISNEQINIVNYNKPLPPLKLTDLNNRNIFNERDTENPEIRDMFKAIGIIESFGTGIGEAKRALKENGSPDLYYKIFNDESNVTSVVILANEEYLKIKSENIPSKNIKIESESQAIKKKIIDSKYNKTTKENMVTLYNKLKENIFSSKDIIKILSCSEATATSYIKKLKELPEVIIPVEGNGKGKYRFIL